MDNKVLAKIEEFFKKYRHQKYKKGELLIRAGENPKGVFFLTSGAVKEYAISKKGEELVVNMFKPVAFFPMSWAINNIANNYYFEAMDDVEVWIAPQMETINFVKENSDVLYNLMSRVFKGTDGILMRMVYLMSGSAYARVITELLIQGKRFGKKGSADSTELTILEKDLANQAGMTRETVSREMKILKDKGLITFVNNVLIINNIDKLEEELAVGY